MGTLFEEANDPTLTNEKIDNYLDMYVGDGKKYASVEELAKAYYNADNFIPKLKEDLDDLKEFTMAQLKERAEHNANNEPNPPANNPNGDGGEPQNPAPASPPKGGAEEEVSLDERIRRALDERDNKKRLQNNAKLTEDVMQKHFGSREKAVEAIRLKAEELEVSPQFLADMAFSSPKAFFKTMEITEEAPRSHNSPNPSSDVNPRMLEAANPGPKPNTYAYYENMRKTNPSLYKSFDVQRKLMEDALRLGNDFFKR